MQRRSLVRARGLDGFRQALVDLALAGGPLEARRRVVIVPTRSSGELLRQAIERTVISSDRPAVVFPDLLTRDDWLGRLYGALADRPRVLSRLERELLLALAARRTADRAWRTEPPFRLRPGLVAAMLDLYDELRRRQRTVRRFVRSLFDQLRVERGTDRGSESLLEQTCYLGFTFLAYERGVSASGDLDEHGLRSRLIAEQPTLPFDHVIVAVTDRPLDLRGLWPADFDLLGRLRRLSRVDVVATDETLDAGFRGRVELELPGISEIGHPTEPVVPVVVRPPVEGGALCTVSRDREEELKDVARAIRSRAGEPLAGSTAIVFQRPLPYLYVAHQVLADAGVPYQTFDAQPLASEPFAALLDLVLAVARTRGTRETVVALLESTLLSFDTGDGRLRPTAVQALSQVLVARRETGEADVYEAAVRSFFGHRSRRDGLDREAALGAARVAAAVCQALVPFGQASTASTQVRTIGAFLKTHERDVPDEAAGRERHQRARAAVLGALNDLAAAYARHGDDARSVDNLIAAIRHVIEAQTFAPRRGRDGVHLVDAAAARFGAFDHVHLVGLVESDWPERRVRNIFYTSGLLEAMGWPEATDQLRAQQAAFRDLLGLAARTTRLHAFELDGDTVVALSPMVQVARDWPSVEMPGPVPTRVFADEIVTDDSTPAEVLPPDRADWLRLRRARPARGTPSYSGFVGSQAPRPYRVSQVDQFTRCPFKYFASSVVGLREERGIEAGLTPLERGVLVHEIFERFYTAWRDQRGGAITSASLADALEMFRRVVREVLERLPGPDRALEETRLLGSLVARGLAERVFQLEVEAGGEIVDRLIEVPLEGTFAFPEAAGLRDREIAIRAKADRIDVFDDGTIRVIDYKLGRPPDLETSVQVGVYAHAARQQLEQNGRQHPVRAAMYLAFGDDRTLEGRLGRTLDDVEPAIRAQAAAFAAAVARIEAGEFPARPVKTGDCRWCAYAGFCRKEYYREDDDAAQSV
jgi:RecB family exonuclease